MGFAFDEWCSDGGGREGLWVGLLVVLGDEIESVVGVGVGVRLRLKGYG